MLAFVMRSIMLLLMCLFIGTAFAESKEEVQQPIPPVANDTSQTEKADNGRNTPPEKTVPIINNIYVGEKREVHTKSKDTHPYPEPNKWTDPLTIFTGLLALITGGLVYVAWKQNETIRTIERAYVVMTHSPPGLIIDKTTGQFWVAMQVENSGRTPARIVRKSLACKTLPKDSLPPDVSRFREENRRNKELTLRLVAQDKFFFSFFGQAEDITSIQNGIKSLWLYGFVDYIDQFGRPDCALYIRRYEPRLDEQPSGMSSELFAQRSNLIFEE